MNVNSTAHPVSISPNATFRFNCKKGTARYHLDNGHLHFDNQNEPPADFGYSTAKTFELLIRNAGNVVSREEIFEYAWEGRVVTQNSLNQVISQLRDAIADDKDKRIIRTVSRKGYIFSRDYVIEPVTGSDEPPLIDKDETSMVVVDDLDTSVVQSNPRPLTRLWIYGALIIASLGLWLFKIDFGLLLSDRFVTRAQTYNKTSVIYVAATSSALSLLETRLEPWLKDIEPLNARGKVIIINDSLDYYDVYCLLEIQAPRFVFLSKNVALDRAQHVMKECLE